MFQLLFKPNLFNMNFNSIQFNILMEIWQYIGVIQLTLKDNIRGVTFGLDLL